MRPTGRPHEKKLEAHLRLWKLFRCRLCTVFDRDVRFRRRPLWDGSDQLAARPGTTMVQHFVLPRVPPAGHRWSTSYWAALEQALAADGDSGNWRREPARVYGGLSREGAAEHGQLFPVVAGHCRSARLRYCHASRHDCPAFRCVYYRPNFISSHKYSSDVSYRSIFKTG